MYTSVSIANSHSLLTETNKTGAIAKVNILLEQVIWKTLKGINKVTSNEIPDSILNFR